MKLALLGLVLILFASHTVCDDIPCAKRPIEGQSVLCICNATYCDTITSETPGAKSYIAYTTTEGGKRFDKSIGSLQKYDNNDNDDDAMTISLDVETRYQTIVGFGGATTDSAGAVWQTLSSGAQDNLIDSYFSSTGIEYSMLRVPIGGTDFSPDAYAYNEYPENDTYLTNFTLAYEDYQYKIPMIKAASQAATRDIRIVSTTWSPPEWMKNRDTYTGYSRLLPEYYQTYALYHKKFLEQYQDNGIKVWAITTGNEPIDGDVGVSVNTMGWNVTNFANWICDYLNPTISDSSVSSTKILANDDQRLLIEYWVYGMYKARPGIVDCLDGIAVHWYADTSTSPDILARVNVDFPQLPVLYTEASFGATDNKVILGSWSRAEQYATDILQNLAYSVTGWIEWNLCLNQQGGPTWKKDYLDSPIIVNADDDEFMKQPMFYTIGHFSKFIPRGSQRIGQYIENGLQNVTSLSFLTPNEGGQQTIVTVILNTDTSSKNIVIDAGDQQCAVINVDPQSITTVKINTNSYSGNNVVVSANSRASARAEISRSK